MTITAITFSHPKREPLMNILNSYIENQSLITEWLIIRKINEPMIRLQEHNRIKYIYNTEVNYDCLSNNIIVFLDDDDYHFDNAIDYCFHKLKNDNIDVIKSNNIYVYDILLDQLYQTEYEKPFMIKKSSLNINNSIIISCEKLYLKLVHSDCINFNREQYISKVLTKKSYIPYDYIFHFIPVEKLNIYKNTLYNKPSYDIGILAGGFGCITWSPDDDNLGGSEQAVVNIAGEWSDNNNKNIIVYGNFKESKIIKNVHYVPWYYYDRNYKYPILILWRRYGIVLSLMLELKYNKLLIDLHDTYCTLLDIPNLDNVFKKATKVMLKSNYHKISIEEYFNLSIDNCAIIENGTRINKFINPNTEYRNPYRFCYCSSFDRGLINILENIWPVIKKKIPMAELHIYYGMDYIFDENFKKYVKNLFSESIGIMYHGRQSVDIIAREKWLSTFHLYISDSPAEIDCISVKESIVAKCIPLISNFGVFKDRQGVHYELGDYNKIATDIVDLTNDFDKVENIRNSFDLSIINNWRDIAIKWLDAI